jgi:hypothetical protein
MDFHFIPECYVDTNLIETLVPPTNRGYNHQKGCSTVAKTMLEHNQLKDGFAVGIIDKDRREVDYSKQFDILADIGQLQILKHPDKHHYFIRIAPAIEKWIIQNAEEVGINLKDYGLSSDLKTLCKIAKTVDSKSDVKFKQLFKDLKNKEASGIVKLTEWLSYLKEENYKADPTFFKK